MKNQVFKFLLAILAFLHLTLVTLSAFYIEIPNILPGKSLVDFYRKASGADSSYGFFAPSIGSKTRALFDIVLDDGRKIENVAFAPDAGREAQIRLGGIWDEFIGEDSFYPRFRQSLAASLAAAVLSKHPQASGTIIHIQEYLQPTMEEYQQGERELWAEYYTARFLRKSSQSEDMQ